MHSQTTLSSRSQITVPAWARRQLRLGPGARLLIRMEDGRLVIEPVRRSVDDLMGALSDVYGGPDVTIDELREHRGW